jgi:hypothetical protein
MKNQISVDLDISQALTQISVFHAKQLPFVVAASLTDTAKAAQHEVRRQMPRKFNLFNPKFLPSGVRIIPADKREAFPESVVYSRDDWMALQEEGGKKRPQRSAHLAIPTAAHAAASRTGSGKIKKAARAKSLLRLKAATDAAAAGRKGGRGNKGTGTPKPFYLKARNGHEFIVKREARGRPKLETLYHFERDAGIKARWNFEKTVTGVARSKFLKLFNKRFQKAIQ